MRLSDAEQQTLFVPELHPSARIEDLEQAVVGNKAVELGQYVQPGVRLLALVSMNNLYVDANFKETQLASIRPGQKVDVSVDALGGKVIPGVVTSISPASGAQFSLLPPDNASGNFVKVVQRVPVKLAWVDLPSDVELQAGLSADVTVELK